MPDVSIQQPTFERLQLHAKPFVDTPDMVINRALDALEQLAGQDGERNRLGPEGERRIDHRALPNLTHTKVLEVSIDGQPLAKANWNSIHDQLLRLAMKRVGSFDKLRPLSTANIVPGRKDDEGYGYLPDIDISVQGQDANGACRSAVALAQALGAALEIGFMWRLKEAAAHPGARGRILV